MTVGISKGETVGRSEGVSQSPGRVQSEGKIEHVKVHQLKKSLSPFRVEVFIKSVCENGFIE